MKRRLMLGMMLCMTLFGAAACRSLRQDTSWQSATVMVLGEGTSEAWKLEGMELQQYLRTFSTDELKVYRPSQGTRTGYLLIDGIRYRITHAHEADDSGRELLTIHAGARPIHLRQKKK